jgi:hypothetical protein
MTRPTARAKEDRRSDGTVVNTGHSRQRMWPAVHRDLKITTAKAKLQGKKRMKTRSKIVYLGNRPMHTLEALPKECTKYHIRHGGFMLLESVRRREKEWNARTAKEEKRKEKMVDFGSTLFSNDWELKRTTITASRVEAHGRCC